MDLTLLLKAKDEMSSTVGSAAGKIKDHGKAIGLAFTAAGAAGLALAGESRRLTAALSVTAEQLDVNTDELRDLVLETTNVTFPIEEVTASFDLLTRAGEENAEQMAAIATEMDTLGDAIGKPASEVTAKLVPAFKAFGIELVDTGEHVDAFTFLTRETTVGLDEFSTLMVNLAPEIETLGLELEDTIVIMAALEEKGISGAAATRAMRTAVTEAAKGEVTLAEALGLTTAEIEAQEEALDEYNGQTQVFADLSNEQFGIIDNMKQKFSELKVRVGAMIEPFEGIFAGLTALGPIMIGLSSSVGQQTVKLVANKVAWIATKVALVASTVATAAATSAQWLLNAALSANPIGLVVLAVIALIAIVVTMTDKWGAVVDFFKGVWEKIIEIFTTAIDNIVGFFTGMWDTLSAVFTTLWGNITGFFSNMWNSVLDTTKAVFLRIADVMLQPMRSTINIIIDGINWLITQLNKIEFSLPSWIPGVGGNSFGINIGQVPKWLAEGAIITKPTIVGVGEGGAEAIMPLNRINEFIGKGATIVNVFLNGDEVTDLLVERVTTELKLQGVAG